jgi:hypothetical protein
MKANIFFPLYYFYLFLLNKEVDQVEVQVQGFQITQHCLNSCLVFYSITATCSGRVALDGNPEPEPDNVEC